VTLYQDLWSQLPIPALLVTNDESVQELNLAAEQFLGISAKVILGQPIWNYLRGEELLPAGMERVRATARPIVISQIKTHGRTNAPQTCTVHLCPMTGAEGQILILLIAHETLGNRFRESAPLSAAHSAIGMAEMLAHEIKNPLAGITGAAQFLSLSLPTEDLEMTDLIVEESKRIVCLLDQVEQFGDVTPPSCTSVNIHDVLDRATRSAVFGFAGEVQIQKNYDPSLPEVWADADQLVQVFLNLIKNACEALGSEGKVTIRTFYDPSLRLPLADRAGRRLPLHVEIIDNGPGLPTALANHVFEPFVTSKNNGKGLGLALVSKIITQHRAWISVTSQSGLTNFRVSLSVQNESRS
jgi:two-component system nitrogen regulation sensor histidine kinase GlnL